MAPKLNDLRNDHTTAGRPSRGSAATNGRRRAHGDRRGPVQSSGRTTTPGLHVTPNAIVATGGGWGESRVTRFAKWLTDGATDRPHLRF